jgi:hypothetical protein
MTPEQFCMWLEGFLDGNELMDADLKEKLQLKLASVGQAPAKAQPKNDKPKTVDRDDGFRGVSVDALISGGLARGGFLTNPAGVSLGGTVGVGYDPTMTTMCVNTANVGSSSEAH